MRALGWIVAGVVVLVAIVLELRRRQAYVRGWESAKRGEPVGADFFTNADTFRLGHYEAKGGAPKKY